MKHPTPKTPEEMERECLGVIAGVARDIERAAMEGNASALETHFSFMKAQVKRLDLNRTSVRQAPREF